MAVIDVEPPTANLSRMARSRAEVMARVREADFKKLAKFSAVSAVAFPLTQVMLLLFTNVFDWSAVAANVTSVSLLSVPAYILNRYWVWGKTDKNQFMTEILPFWIVTIIGLVLSTVLAHYAEMWWPHSPVAANLANTAGFGAVWIFKFLFLDKVMFGAHQHFPVEEELEAELETSPAT
jgi:putative flippase GtrA